MKKIISILLIIALLTSMTSAFAIEKNENKELYINTADVPQAAINYVTNNASRLLWGRYECGEYSLEEISSMYVGTPFALYNSVDTDLYYFPIILDGEIVLTLRVYIDSKGEYTGILSGVLAEELSKLDTTQSVPAKIVARNGGITADIGEKHSVLVSAKTYAGEDDKSSAIVLGENATNSVVNIMSPITIDHELNVAESNAARTFPAYRYIVIGRYIVETQTTLPWCSAYVGSLIVRFYTSSTTTPLAADVMAAAYPTETVAQRQSHGITNAKMKTYLQNCGYSVVDRTITRLTDDEAKTLIVNDKVTLLHTTSGHANHALALVGYSDTSSIWKIWNPWNSGLEDLSMTTLTYVTVDGESYEWVGQMTVQ